jgi:hypothetical protein
VKPARRAWIAPVVALAAYLALRALFAALTEDDGLLTPSGSPRLGVVAAGILVIALRIVVVFLLPAVAAYRLLAPPARSAQDRTGLV